MKSTHPLNRWKILHTAWITTAACILISSSLLAGETETENIFSGTGTYCHANVIVTVAWDDDDNRDGLRPNSIDLYLLKDGCAAAEKKVTAGEGWTCAFTGLPLSNENTHENRYCVAESTVPGYSVSQDRTEGKQAAPDASARNIEYTVLYKREPSATSFCVNTFWNDSMDHEKKRPKQTKVQLYADGSPYGSEVSLSRDKGWRFCFKDLPENKGGKKISYTVSQTSVPDRYHESVSTDENGNILIENRYDAAESVSDDSSDMILLSGGVKWEDADDQDGIRPGEIEVLLTADGRQIARKTVSEEEGWTYSFDSLPEYTNGTKIEYSLDASPVSGYEVHEESGSLICVHDPETTCIQGKILWAGENRSASLRPETVFLTLLSDGTILRKIKVTGRYNWSFSVPSLPVYSHGKEICYTLEPCSIAGYKESVEGMTVTYTEDPSAITAETGSDTERQPPETERTGTAETETLPSSFPFLTVLLALFAAAAAAVLLLRKKNRKASKGKKQERWT